MDYGRAAPFDLMRTPHAVTVDIESPGTGQLGKSGIDGPVDNR